MDRTPILTESLPTEFADTESLLGWARSRSWGGGRGTELAFGVHRLIVVFRHFTSGMPPSEPFEFAERGGAWRLLLRAEGHRAGAGASIEGNDLVIWHRSWAGQLAEWLRSAGRRPTLVEAVAPIAEAFERGQDLVVTARLVLFPDARSRVEKHCRPAIRHGEYEWAECRACGRRYSPAECGRRGWSAKADARAEVGGSHLSCPAGHVIFPIQTWVA